MKLAEVELPALDLMCVDPEHHYRGAGTLLMQMGVDAADRLGVEVFHPLPLCHCFVCLTLRLGCRRKLQLCEALV
jgi:GNAT superfamily N-acetyltransferase